MDHYKNPRNWGSIKERGEKSLKEVNPLCGDEMMVYVLTDGGKITDVKFEGRGCVISQAAASMLSEKIKGQPIATLKKMTPQDALKKVDLESITSGRLQCALLFYSTVKKLLFP